VGVFRLPKLRKKLILNAFFVREIVSFSENRGKAWKSFITSVINVTSYCCLINVMRYLFNKLLCEGFVADVGYFLVCYCLLLLLSMVDGCGHG
jgi:cation transporter-like permease